MYEMGTANGLAVRWFANGVKKSEGVVLNGKPTGLWKYWKEDGSLLLEKQY
jgi:antitoxin component YwqK of YwqJK toxin-antitoxin module